MVIVMEMSLVDVVMLVRVGRGQRLVAARVRVEAVRRRLWQKAVAVEAGIAETGYVVKAVQLVQSVELVEAVEAVGRIEGIVLVSVAAVHGRLDI